MNSSIFFAIVSLMLSCHLKYTKAQFRVRGDDITSIERTPHTVAFFERDDEDKVNYICTGSLVNMNSVVTVAHQFEDRHENQLIVVAGITYLSDLITEGPQKRSVDNIHYCGYDPNSGSMDIAVVKVCEPFIETDRVKSISLCQTRLEPGLDLKISGWGSINSDSLQPSNRLRSTEVPIMARTRCEYIYASRYDWQTLPETLMCAECTGRDPCYGDVGAGGIVSGELCAVVTCGCEHGILPTLFTNVTNPAVNAFLNSVI